MNEHYTETRIVARIAGEVAQARKYDNHEEVQAQQDRLDEVVAKLIARGIPQKSIDQAIARPIHP